MYKKGLFICLMAIMQMACSPEPPCGGCGKNEQEEEATISFRVQGSTQTKATSASDASIGSGASDIQILVFDGSGNLIVYGANEDGTTTVTMECRTGDVTCYAVVNSPEDLSEISTVTSLLRKTSYLKDGSPSSLQMIGSASKTIVTGNNSVTIPVKRFASKVQIDKITPAFSNAAHRSMEFKLRGIYLVNVNGTCPYTQTSTAASSNAYWYNRMKYTSGDCNSLCSDILSSPVTMQTSGGVVTAYTTPHYFYCYPNPTATDTQSSSWSARYTRLVVEASLGGTIYFYPVNIPTPEANTVYRITNLKITGLGSESPDEPVSKGTVSCTISVSDWTTGFSKEVEY